jgi:hypothetical protein
MVGYGTLEVIPTLISTIWCLEISTTKSREILEGITEFDHNVLLLYPTNTPQTFRRVGVGIVWHNTVLKEQKKGDKPFENVSKTLVHLV